MQKMFVLIVGGLDVDLLGKLVCCLKSSNDECCPGCGVGIGLG